MIRLLFGLSIYFAVGVSSAQAGEVVPINIFGDGNPENGIEDSREQLMGKRGRGGGLVDQQLNAGTIKCDGKIRGTAMVVDTSELAPRLEGVVLASAAHVLYDLSKNRLFRRCEFHFMGLGQLGRYRAKIDLENTRLGNFDPLENTTELTFGEGDWAFLHVPRVWKNFNPDESVPLREFSFSQMESFQQSGGEMRLIAFDSSTGVVSVSRDCTVIESKGNDLGGGDWKGQLLDNCDSADGASGGGIIAVMDQQQFLVGIRNGSHWSEELFPASEYPLGPPDGALWDHQSNTNFGRAIDGFLLNELRIYIESLANKKI